MSPATTRPTGRWSRRRALSSCESARRLVLALAVVAAAQLLLPPPLCAAVQYQPVAADLQQSANLQLDSLASLAPQPYQTNNLAGGTVVGHPQQQPTSSLRGGGAGGSPSNGRRDQLGNGGGHESPIFRYNGVALNSSAVRLVWNLVNGVSADGFELRYGPIPDATEMFSANLNGSSRDFTVGSLQPETQYQFRLLGFSNGHAYRPQLALVKTMAANSQSRQFEFINREITPLGVKAEPRGNNSIQLSWTEAERPANLRNSLRLNIIRYHVISSNSSSSSGPTAASGGVASGDTAPAQVQYHYLNVTQAQAPESKIIVQKLRAATEYAFAVKTAYYSPDMRRLFTQSAFSMDTSAKTLDLEPSAPRNFTIQVSPLSQDELLRGETPKLELYWQAPESPNGLLKQYAILYSHDQNVADDKWWRIQVNDTSTNNWEIVNLKQGHSYYFKMRAINQRGESGDSEMRMFVVPAALPQEKLPIPPNNVLMLIVICLVAILFVLFLVVSRLFCRTRSSTRKARKGSLNNSSKSNKNNITIGSDAAAGAKLNGFCSPNGPAQSQSTVTGRVGTLARRRVAANQLADSQNKPDFWISATDSAQQQLDIKSNLSDKSSGDLNMAMVSIQRESPHAQFVTQTQIAPALPEYRFAAGALAEQQLMQQLAQQQQSHYHPGQFGGPNSALAFDQMDSATASALMTLSKRQQQQMQKYQIQFAATSGGQAAGQQAPSPHQQPPPPPPLNIEQQQQQPLYGTHQPLGNTRSLRLHRPTLYDPVSGAFVQGDTLANVGQPPNYSSHLHSLLSSSAANAPTSQSFSTAGTLNSISFHQPNAHHQNQQANTLMSRRSTNTLRSFQSSNGPGGGTYGQLGSFGSAMQHQQQQPPPPNSQQLLHNHQAVINQLNNSTYPSLPLKHVSTVRPQIMSSLEDQIEMELAEKETLSQVQSQQQQQQQD